jgi:Ca2+-binding EF-hand superfamily protein
MATQNVNIGINISDNGTAQKTIKSVNQLHSTIKATQKSAEKLAKPTPKPAGYKGVAAAGPVGSEAMLSPQEYGRGRGSMGATGAAGRDFANQAQGLGGIVRLYATYAANLFAVGAAFRALSGAMDTANLVKGLDQLGAASGTALGTLSKRLVEVTDGAISMREAMESTAKAVSSGMSSENLLRMGKVAKQAAQALGVDMADAVNRLTRGITKLEPELLDEIGIFTKVDMATQAYAKSVGKSTSAITDFEKRMAFANAVLEEGERKFSAIDFETNPYTKLLASLKDVAQAGLEVVNAVLVPAIKFLSENPKALALAIGALSISLVKQALPALGQFKAGLAAASEEATQLAAKKGADAVRAQKQLNVLLLQERDNFAEEQLRKVDAAAEQLEQAGIKSATSASRLINSTFAGLDAEGVKNIESQIKKVNLEADKYTRLAQQAAKAGESPRIVKGLEAKAEAYRNAAYAAQSSLKAEIEYEKTSESASKRNFVAKLQADGAEKARIASLKQSIVTNAAYNGSLIGPIGALKLMSAEIVKSNLQLSVFGKSMLFARAAVASFAGMVTTVISSIGGFINVIAIIGAAVAFASAMFSKNSKQMGEFNMAIDATDESLANLSRTLDDINKKPFGQQFNTQSLMAASTAINEITNSMSSLIQKMLSAEQAAGSFDKFIDLIKSAWGGDTKSKFAESISSTVFGAFEQLEDSPQAQKAKQSLAAILEISPEASKASWEEAFAAIIDNGPKLKLVENAMKAFGLATGQTADDAQQFDLAMTQSKEALKSFTDEFRVKDTLSLFAESIVSASEKTAKALEDPERAIARLASVIADPKQFELFSSTDQKKLIDYGDQITNINTAFEQQKSKVKDSQVEIRKLQAEYEKLRQGAIVSDETLATTDPVFEQAKKQLDARRAQLAREQQLLASTQQEIATLTARFPDIAANQLARGADLLGMSIQASFAKANTAFADAVMGAVGDLPGLAKQRYDMEMRKLSSEATLLDVQKQMLRATMANTVMLQQRSAEEAVSIAKSDIRETGGDAEALKRLAEAQKELDQITEKARIINIDPKQALKAINDIKKAALEGNSVVAKNASELLNYVNSLSGIALQERNNQDAQAAAKFKQELQTRAEIFNEAKKLLDLDKESTAANIQSLEVEKARNEFLTLEQIAQVGIEKSRLSGLESAQQLLAVQQKIDALEQAKSKGGKFAPKEEVYQAELFRLTQQKINIERDAGLKLSAQALATTKEQTTEAIRLFNEEQKLSAIRKSGTDALKDAAMKAADIENTSAKEAQTFTPDYQAQRDAEMAATRAVYESEREQVALTTDFIVRNYALQMEAKRLLDDPAASQASIDRVRAQIAVETEAYANKMTSIATVTAAELDSIAKIEAARQETASFDNLISSIQSLESAFESMGSGVSSTVKAFADASKSQKQYAANIAELQTKQSKFEQGSKEFADLESDIADQRRKSAKDEISSYGKIAGSAKTLFKEKSTGYKVLAAVEKVMHITRLGMDVAEMVSDTTKTGVSIANSTARTGASIIEAGVNAVAGVVKAIASMPFPLNIIAGVATAAVMAGLMSQIGGKRPGVEAGGGFSAEDRQETQGTGMSWVDGKKVETSAGVYGDPTQKLDSINKGIQAIKDSTIEGLFYDNRMLRALERIAQSITGAATALYAIPGIASGLNFGTLPGSSRSGGGLIDSVFGGKTSTTKEIEDVGIQLRGNVGNLIVKQYKDLVETTTKDGGWFGSDKTTTSRSRQTMALGADISAAFVDIFKGARDLFTEVGALAGVSAQKVINAFNKANVSVDISLKGLTGPEAIEQLNAVISGELDKIARSLFSGFEKFRKFGEGLTDTVIRVVDSNMKVTVALGAMGLATDKVSGNFTVSEQIINNMAGSLETFTDQAKFFIDNFLSDAERVAILQKGMAKELTDLGLSTQLTRDEFKKLVQMQDLSTSTGRLMYQALMDLQEGLFKVTQRLEDLKAESRDLGIELLMAQGHTEAANAAIDALATEGMTKAELNAYNYNKTLKAQIEATEAAKKVAEERVAVEQKLLQLAGDTIALRTIELRKLDESNRGLQLTVWAVEYYTKVVTASKTAIDKAAQDIDAAEKSIAGIRSRGTDQYVAASDKVANAQKSIADLAIEAAKKMQTFGKTLRDFISEQLTPKTTSQNATRAFSQNLGLALTGDTVALEKVPELAQAAIDAAKASARSSQEFNSTRAAILAGVTNVAKYAEEQAGLTQIPGDEDPLVAANRTLEEAIRDQTKALEVANQLGASLVKTPEDLVALYKEATQELADSILDKDRAEKAREAAQKALIDLVGNSGQLIKGLTESTKETKDLGNFIAKELSDGINVIDENLDRKLTYRELVAGLKGKATDAEIKLLIEATDLNADNMIDAYELNTFNSTISIIEALGSGFDLIDTNLDGKVSEAEFMKTMANKASDDVLATIFDLIDADNDKIITATELAAAKSVITADNSKNLPNIKDGITSTETAVVNGAVLTSITLDELDKANLLVIKNNTATTVKAIAKLLDNNVALFEAMNAVAFNTKALADAVGAASKSGSSSKAGGGNLFVDLITGAIDVTVDLLKSGEKVVKDVWDSTFGKVFSDERTKKDITLHSRLSNGIGIYDYSYKAPYSQYYGTDRKRGVLAQEVKGKYPNAVSTSTNGMYMVDYSKLPVPTDILKFAAGGVFSNQVVTRPTNFQFGLMGEAGPEAIMPLSRTRDGSLGVVAQTTPGDSTTREMLTQNAELIQEVRQLREEVSLLRFEARATASATNKTTRILERVTRDGESLLVTDAATV